MKISNITFLNNNFQNSIQKTKKTNETNKIAQQKTVSCKKLPTTKDYLAFLGYSGNLRKTLEHLTFDECPFQIYDSILAELSKSNPNNKTLYDVHFEKYKNVLNYYSLDELKADFPEFEGVVSSYDVEAEPDSVVGEFQNNESEIFTSEEDLTLQLIKLYWGQGFSLNDLSDFVAQHSSDKQGKNLYYTMKKLNIPRMQPKYAHVLKFSNRDYFAKYSEQMKIKLTEAHEAKEQRAQGEPVVIPKGVLSEAHKKHISEGLKKYYQENPTAIYTQSERQKRFFAENPQYKEDMSVAMDYAWNRTQEGKTVKKSLTKFMKKYGNIQDEQLLTGLLSSEQKNALNLFWDKNSWAKEKFSIAAKQGWEYAKVDIDSLLNAWNIKNLRVVFPTIPYESNQKILKWAQDHNMEHRCKFFNMAVYDLRIGNNDITQKRVLDETKKIDRILESFEKENSSEMDKIANARLGAVCDFILHLQNNSPELPDSIQRDSVKRDNLYRFLRSICENVLYKQTSNNVMLKIGGVDNGVLLDIYKQMTIELIKQECFDTTGYILKLLNKNYEQDSILFGANN